jgi:formate/nitrite transporter
MQTIDGKKERDEVMQSYNPALTPKELSRTLSALGIRKANTRVWQLLLLGLLAGVYISVGSHLFLVAMQAGMGRLVGGLVFSVGLVLVVVAGAELFTGNIIMAVGMLARQVSVGRMVQNWLVVYLGNLFGALLFVALIWWSGLLFRNGTATPVGQMAGEIAVAKMQLSFSEAFVRGILCNMLVILAIIMATLSKDIISKIACCTLPIMAFVASGFEHSIANMYLIPAGMLAQGGSWASLGESFWNIGPVTLGNIVGGLAILILHPNRIRQVLLLAFKKQV